MKIKYRKLDNVIVSMGACDFSEDSEHGVLEVNQDIPSETISNFKLDGSAIKKRDQAEIDAEVESVKAPRKARKKAIMQKLGLSKQELKALIELIQDGDDD